MSTVAEAELRVRYLLRDRNPAAQAFSQPEVVDAVNIALQQTASDLYIGEASVLLGSTTAGAASMSVTSTPEVKQVSHLRERASGLMIQIVSQDAFEKLRDGDTISSGRPQVSMVREATTTGATVLELVFWPTPDAAYKIDGYRSLMPSVFVPADAVKNPPNLDLDVEGFRAMCLRAAKSLFDRMPSADRQRLSLADTAADEWPGQAASLIAASRRRRIHQKLTEGRRGGRRW